MAGAQFNEKTRVQLPALVHLTRLGYEYFGKISETSLVYHMMVIQIY